MGVDEDPLEAEGLGASRRKNLCFICSISFDVGLGLSEKPEMELVGELVVLVGSWRYLG